MSGSLNVDWDKIADVLLGCTTKLIDQQFAPVLARLEALEAAVASTKGLRYGGIWQAAGDYQRGCLATHAGSLWHCNGTTLDQPGTSHAWTMMLKSGAR